MKTKLEDIDFTILNDATKHAIQERIAGKTYREIGNSLGVSRQRAEQRISRAIKKDAKNKQKIYLSSEQIERLSCFSLKRVSMVIGISYSKIRRAVRYGGHINAYEMQLLIEFLDAS